MASSLLSTEVASQSISVLNVGPSAFDLSGNSQPTRVLQYGVHGRTLVVAR